MKKSLLSLLLAAVLLAGITPGSRAADGAAETVTTPAPETVETAAPLPDETPQPTTTLPPTPAAVEAYTLTRYSTPAGYDLSEIFARRWTGGPVRLSEGAALLSGDLADALDRICRAAEAGEVLIRYNSGSAAAYGDILADAAAVFLAKTGAAAPEELSSALWAAEDVTLLRQVFWDVVCITPVLGETETCTGRTDESGQPVVSRKRVLQINVDSRGLAELSAGLTEEEKALLEVYAAEPVRSRLQSLCLGEADAGAEARLEAAGVLLPEELDPVRRRVVLSACSLAGRVPYFWGGKSECVGWDARWGAPTVITSGGGWQEETVRPFGLDCSGLVAWALINGAQDTGALAYIGHGTDVQFSRCRVIPREEAQPGDVAFAVEEDGSTSHTGVIVGRNAAGELLVCHCSGGAVNIVIEPLALTGCNTVCSPADLYTAYETSRSRVCKDTGPLFFY